MAGAFAVALGTAVRSLLTRDRAAPVVRLDAGDIAPEFTLQASDGRTYRLADFRGRSPVVIAWFPKAFTTGCTAECVSIGLTRHVLGKLDAAIFAASCDSVATNRAFAASTGIDVPILSDPTGAVARAYGVLGILGLPSRWTFYIGTDGRILAVDRQVHTGSHGADMASRLDGYGVSRRP